MIKILPLEENKFNVEPYYRLVICLGYGEHCDDTFTRSYIEINDEKAIKYDSLSEEEMDEMDFFELDEISDCITVKDAEEIVRFINSLWKRKDKNGYNIDHIVLNDGESKFWWQDRGGMTDKEFKWFSKIYEKYQSVLFNPQIEHNWYGISSAKIEYIDENGKVHKCEVI